MMTIRQYKQFAIVSFQMLVAAIEPGTSKQLSTVHYEELSVLTTGEVASPKPLAIMLHSHSPE